MGNDPFQVFGIEEGIDGVVEHDFFGGVSKSDFHVGTVTEISPQADDLDLLVTIGPSLGEFQSPVGGSVVLNALVFGVKVEEVSPISTLVTATGSIVKI